MPDKDALLGALSNRGFKYQGQLLHLFAAGSHLHGAQNPGKNDLDVYGIFIESPVKALGLDKEEHFVTSTSGNEKRNTSEDVDYQLHTLRKWASLAAKGNPTVLGYLFAPMTITGTVWGSHILPNKDLFLASSHAKGFLGMGRNMLHRMQGLRGAGKHGQRPELEQQFGYDTKAAMHMIRMMYECLEFLNTGKITYPRPEKEYLLALRNGALLQRAVENEFIALEQKVLEAEAKSPLPRHVNRDAISSVVTRAYLNHWSLAPDYV